MNPVGYEVIDPLYYERYGYPHASWAYLRQHAPVAWFEPPDMRPFWAITKYADLSAILRDHKRFKIAPRLAVFRAEEEIEPGTSPLLHHLLKYGPPRARQVSHAHGWAFPAARPGVETRGDWYNRRRGHR